MATAATSSIRPKSAERIQQKSGKNYWLDTFMKVDEMNTRTLPLEKVRGLFRDTLSGGEFLHLVSASGAGFVKYDLFLEYVYPTHEEDQILLPTRNGLKSQVKPKSAEVDSSQQATPAAQTASKVNITNLDEDQLPPESPTKHDNVEVACNCADTEPPCANGTQFPIESESKMSQGLKTIFEDHFGRSKLGDEQIRKISAKMPTMIYDVDLAFGCHSESEAEKWAVKCGLEEEHKARFVASWRSAKTLFGSMKTSIGSGEAKWKGSSNVEQQRLFALHELGGEIAVREQRMLSISISEEVRRHLRRDRIPWEQDQIYQGLDCGFLIRDSEEAYGTLRRTCKEIAEILEHEGLQVSTIEGPLKGVMRSQTKVSVKYGGQLCQLSDVARMTLQIVAKGRKTIETTYKALTNLAGEVWGRDWKVLFFDDRYRKPMSSEYRDFLLIVHVCGVLCEVQINFDIMLHIKEGMGHDDYEVERLNQDLMLEAARKNDASAVTQHLGKRCKPDYKTANGFSALAFAALHGNATMAEKLLEAKADPFILDSMGNIPIIRAMERNHTITTWIILKDMALQVEDYSQSLMLSPGACLGVLRAWAVLKTKSVAAPLFRQGGGKKKATEMKFELLDAFQPVFDRISGGVDAALSLAARNGDYQVCESLLGVNANPNIQIPHLEEWKYILDDAVDSGSVPTVRTLMKHRANLGIYAVDDTHPPDKKKRVLLKTRSMIYMDNTKDKESWEVDELSQPQTLQRRSSMRKEVDARKFDSDMEPEDIKSKTKAWHGIKYKSLYKRILCADQQNWQCLDAVLEATNNTWCDRNEMLAKAAKTLALNAARVLLHRDATAEEVNEEDFGPLIRFAVERQDEKMIQQLQKNSLGKNVVERKIFHQAAQTGQLAVLELLVERECMLDKMDQSQTTGAIHLAAASGHTEVIRYLHQQKCNICCANSHGRTPACEAARYGHAQMLLDLSKSGLWNLQEPAFLHGYNAGHGLVAAAAYSSQSETIYALVLAQVDVNRRSDKGATPAHLAAYVGAVNCLRVIAKLGGDLWVMNHMEQYPKDDCRQNFDSVWAVLQESCRGATLGTEAVRQHDREAQYKSRMNMMNQLRDDDSLSLAARRKEWYKSISFKGKTPTSETAILLVGGPGSGKSHVAEKIQDEIQGNKKQSSKYNHNFVYLNKDQVLEDLYENDMEYFSEASAIFKDIRSRAIKQGYNLILDGTGRYVPQYVGIADKIRQPSEHHPSPRRVILVIVLCSLGQALERAAKRYQRTRRKVDEAYIVETYSAMDEVVATYVGPESHHFDAIRIYDNLGEGHEPTKVYERDAEKVWTILDDNKDYLESKDYLEKTWWKDCMPKTAIELQSHSKISKYMAKQFPANCIDLAAHNAFNCAPPAFALFSFGGPGSNSSEAMMSFMKNARWDPKKANVVKVNKNEVLKELFQNDEEFNKRRDLICDGMLSRAVSEGYNLIQDGSGQDTSKCLDIVSRIRRGVIEKGHRKREIVLLITICSRARGLQRQREKLFKKGIKFEEERALAVYEVLDNNTASYLSTWSRHFDRIVIYDGNREDNVIEVIYQKDADGQVRIYGKLVDEEISWPRTDLWWHHALPHTKQAMEQSVVIEKFKAENLRAEPASDFAVFAVGNMLEEQRSSKRGIVDTFLRKHNMSGSHNYVYLNEHLFKKHCKERLFDASCIKGGLSSSSGYPGNPNNAVKMSSVYSTDNFMYCLACQHVNGVFEDICEIATTKEYNIVLDSVGYDQKKWKALVSDVHRAPSNRCIILLVVISKSQLEENRPKATEALDPDIVTKNEAFDQLISSYVRKAFHCDRLYVYEGDCELLLYEPDTSHTVALDRLQDKDNSWLKLDLPETYGALSCKVEAMKYHVKSVSHQPECNTKAPEYTT